MYMVLVLLVSILFVGVLLAMVYNAHKPTPLLRELNYRPSLSNHNMLPNYHPETGIRYGVINPRSLDPDILDALTCNEYLCDVEEREDGDDREGEYAGEYQGVKFHLMYGAMPLLFIVGGATGYASSLCSPCVPNAANLDEPFAGMYDPVNFKHLCYVLPHHWILEHE